MADFDVNNDTLPALTIPSTTQGGKFPTIAALKVAIAASDETASYPAAVMHAMTKNDLIYVCRLHSIACVGL